MILLDTSGESAFWRNSNLAHLDQQLFHLLNGKLHHPFLDALLPFLREPILWVPFYLFILVFGWLNYGPKGFFWATCILATAICCDILSNGIIKGNIYRLRPCWTPYLEESVRFLIRKCPTASSFTSSHATTHFGVASFIYFTLRPLSKKLWWLFVWAGAISYAQVYVGVHYPLDIICGTVLGLSVGWLLSSYFNKQFGLYTFKKFST